MSSLRPSVNSGWKNGIVSPSFVRSFWNQLQPLPTGSLKIHTMCESMAILSDFPANLPALEAM